jgi:LuxR family maltose regulon positive regulatory protein
LLAVKNFHFAVLFLNKLRKLAENYRRPLDLIEIDILRSRALWKLEETRAALEILKGALTCGQRYGYVGMFVREGKELAPMLRIMPTDAGIPKELRELITRIMNASQVNLPVDLYVPVRLSAWRLRLLRHLEQNLSNREIAKAMEISPNTVKTHLKGIFRSLGVSSRKEAVKVAKALNLLDA